LREANFSASPRLDELRQKEQEEVWDHLGDLTSFGGEGSPYTFYYWCTRLNGCWYN
jgi:hypothetical protein